MRFFLLWTQIILFFSQIFQNTFFKSWGWRICKTVLVLKERFPIGCELLTFVGLGWFVFVVFNFHNHFFLFVNFWFQNWNFLFLIIFYRRRGFLITQWKWTRFWLADTWIRAGVEYDGFGTFVTSFVFCLRLGVTNLLLKSIRSLIHLFHHGAKLRCSSLTVFCAFLIVLLNLLASLTSKLVLTFCDIIAGLPTELSIMTGVVELSCLLLVKKLEKIHLRVRHEMNGSWPSFILDEQANLKVT